MTIPTKPLNHLSAQVLDSLTMFHYQPKEKNFAHGERFNERVECGLRNEGYASVDIFAAIILFMQFSRADVDPAAERVVFWVLKKRSFLGLEGRSRRHLG
ncbi:MAG: hypothetical protein ABIL01_10870 [Pseudomonadota bacterium]